MTKIMKTNIFIFILCLLIKFSGYSQLDLRIMAAEYFINSDQGAGKNFTIPIISGFPKITMDVMNLTVPVGSKICVRVMNNQGIWSTPRCLERHEYFTITDATIQYGEYFVNTDKGQGNNKSLTFTNGSADINGLLLKQGDVVYVRIKDSYNRWSPASRIEYHFKDFRRAEYKIKLYPIGNFTSPVYLYNVAPSSFGYCDYTALENNINVFQNDSIWIRFQSMDGFYSNWVNKEIIIPSIEQDIETLNYVKVYPNPNDGTFDLEIIRQFNNKFELLLINALGEIIYNEKDIKMTGTYNQSFDFTKLTEGIYYLKIMSGDLSTFKKIVIQR